MSNEIKIKVKEPTLTASLVPQSSSENQGIHKSAIIRLKSGFPAVALPGKYIIYKDGMPIDVVDAAQFIAQFDVIPDEAPAA